MSTRSNTSSLDPDRDDLTAISNELQAIKRAGDEPTPDHEEGSIGTSRNLERIEREEALRLARELVDEYEQWVEEGHDHWFDSTRLPFAHALLALAADLGAAERERDEAIQGQANIEFRRLQEEIRRLREGWDGWQKQALAAERDRDDADKLCAHWCDEYDCLKEQLEAAREQLAAPRDVTALRVGIDWHAHEGMVTVYDRDGRYLGCMGVERFHRLLAEDAISRGSNPAKERDA